MEKGCNFSNQVKLNSCVIYLKNQIKIPINCFLGASSGVILQSINSTQDTITISWLPPDDLNGVLVAYEIAYSTMEVSKNSSEYEEDMETISDFYDVPKTPMHYEIDLLQADTLYLLSVIPFTIQGSGPAVNVSIRTLPSEFGKSWREKYNNILWCIVIYEWYPGKLY